MAALVILLALLCCHLGAGRLVSKPLCGALSKRGTFSLTMSSQFLSNTMKGGVLFVGGKGGVGKTSTSSALALNLSDKGLRTLIVSTDPAHSLGDALDVDLKSGQVTRVVTETNLWAVEVNAQDAADDLMKIAMELQPQKLAQTLGIPVDILDSLGLEEILSVFTNLPPGIDEIVSLVKIFDYLEGRNLPAGLARFDRVVVDTAPTGHTLRLLQLPQFLEKLTATLIKLRNRFGGLISQFQGLFGGEQGSGGMDKLNAVLDKAETLQRRLAAMKVSLKDNGQTQFVVVTIPTSLAVAESTRLLADLRTEGILVSSIVCNQIVSDTAGLSYLNTRRAAQAKSMTSLAAAIEGINVRRPPALRAIELTAVPYIESEVTSIYGLRFFGTIAHSSTNPMDSRKLTIFGGKGGVGKTTSAASWAVRLADSGLKTLVVSTDPAHSLGDAFKESLSGSPRLLDSPAGGGQLWAMEIDPRVALAEFRDVVGGMMEGEGEREDSSGGEVADFIRSITDLPPGSDEIVAMAKVMTYLDQGFALPDGSKVRFERVVLDTAPTGHTLRMLKLPQFLRDAIEKTKKIRSKKGAIDALFGGLGSMMGGKASRPQQADEADTSKLDAFQQSMERLDRIIHEPKEAEFTVVTIATEVARAETERLLQSLEEDGILVRRVIVNQLLEKAQLTNAADEQGRAAEAEIYLGRLRAGQRSALAQLDTLARGSGVPLVQVPFFDYEVRTVYGLRAVGAFLK